jgi:Family of unknown function (DUF5681)
VSEPFGEGGETEPASPSIDEDDDRHPRYPGRRRNGQLRKGFSGNRKGRPRRARSTRAIFQEMLQSKVPMMVNGKLKKMTVVEAMAARVKREALAGPLRGLEKGVGVAQMYSLPELVDEEKQINFEVLTDEEFETYGRLLHKLWGVPWEESSSADFGSPDRKTQPAATSDREED